MSATVEQLAADVASWRIAHRAYVSHMTSCRDCGLDLCQDGQALWDAADQAEAVLPWAIGRTVTPVVET